MKKIIFVLLLGVVTLLLGACNKPTIIEMDLDNDLYTFEELLEMADHITIVKVEGIDHTDLDAETVQGSSIEVPRTYFTVTSLYNIKEPLPDNTLVGVIGGYNDEDQFVEYTLDQIKIPGEYNLFDIGSYYIMVLHEENAFPHLGVHPYVKLDNYNPDKPPHEQSQTIIDQLIEYGFQENNDA